MRSIIKSTKFFIPLLTLVVGIGFVFFFEFYIKDHINTVDVIVASENINFKDRITMDDLEVRQMKIENKVDKSYRKDELEYIIGEFASIDITKGTQLYPQLIDSYDLIPDESKGEFVAPIPNQWLFAVPGSLRRSYVADIYLVGNKDQRMLEALVSDSKEYEEGDKKDDGKKESQVTNKPLQSQEDVAEFVKSSATPILTDVRVSSVKDSGNREVTQAAESNSAESATANVSELEIIATAEMLQILQDSTNKGYQLYIVYKYERSNKTDEDVNSVENDDVSVFESDRYEDDQNNEDNNEQQDNENVNVSKAKKTNKQNNNSNSNND